MASEEKKKKDQKLDILQYKTREEALEKAFEKFCEAQDEIDNISSSPEETAERVSLEERYYDILTNLKRLAQSGAEQNCSSVQNINPSTVATKMPEIVIEKFTGLQQNWASFFDIFKALVLNNSDLADVQKLIYLKSSLKGEPLKLVETLSLTSANLQVAIKILTERYENKLATIYSHIKGLVELPSITKSNPTSLREFVVSIKQNTESLKNLQVPVESWNLILVYILSQKLDFHTRKAYELEPTENLSSPEIKRKTAHFAISNSDIRSDNNATKIQNACTYCKAYDHAIYKCSKFKDLPGFQRKQFVFNKRLCFKCFLKHPVDQCRWKNCPICGQSHHSLLHSQGHSKPMFNNNQNGNNFHSQNKVYLNQSQGQGSAGAAGPSQGCVVPKTVALCENSPLDNSLNKSCQSRDNNQRRSEGNSDVQNPKAEKRSGSLKVYELQDSLDVIIKFLQQKHFSHEISFLKDNKAITNKGLLSLSPFLDQSGILRVGGRLSNAEIPYSQKYPILFPSKNHVVTLMIKREHRDSLSAYPEKELLDVPDNRLSIWQKCVKIQQTFWKRWSVEYLNRLQNKPKWLSPSKNLIVNQVVLLKEDNTPPLRWPLARIVEIIPGADGKVRVVKLRTKDGIFTRPIAKICPLPDERKLEEVPKIVETVDSD
ncbi:hypothetical protein NQ314_019375 [Rhamnusium bicolor]|uniref:DUF5641 domain-containing protein n=1 Tax=Rhamnusium bicolor TaxID=1586634 RepID=A0AAV8WPA2_9CUCU|nr:hypothetical protein NQ314_019375 [Rhamnusium bicolor]